MLIPQLATCDGARLHGCGRGNLTELRRALARPSALNDGNRRRLLGLAQRLARVQALGDEYTRVCMSDEAAALAGAAAGV